MRIFPVVVLLAACQSPEDPFCVDCPDAIPAWPEEAVTPDQARAEIEVSAKQIVGLGDLDSDGMADIAIATSEQVLVFSGATLTAGGVLTPDDALASISWEDPTIALAGDPDDDGLADLLVGDSDAWKLYSGAALTGSLGRNDADATFRGTEGRPMLSGAGGGDLDGDGTDDLIFSDFTDADGNKRDNEEVSVVFGGSFSSGTAINLGDETSLYGAVVDGDGPQTLAFIGDFDDDGLDDVASGALRNFAAVHAAASIDGPGQLSDHEVHLHDCHPETDCPSGVRISWAGDVDGDAYDDLIATAYPSDNAWVIPGFSIYQNLYKTVMINGTMAEQRRITGAETLIGLGDIDDQESGDGNRFSDLLATDGGDTAYLIKGNQLANESGIAMTDAIHSFEGFASDNIGIGAPGDVDGNGHADVIVYDSESVHLVLAP